MSLQSQCPHSSHLTQPPLTSHTAHSHRPSRFGSFPTRQRAPGLDICRTTSCLCTPQPTLDLVFGTHSSDRQRNSLDIWPLARLDGGPSWPDNLKPNHPRTRTAARTSATTPLSESVVDRIHRLRFNILPAWSWKSDPLQLHVSAYRLQHTCPHAISWEAG